MGLSDAKIMRTIEAIQAHGSQTKAAHALGIHRRSVGRHIQIALKRQLVPTSPVVPGFEVTRISTTQDADGNVKSQSIQQKPETERPSFEMPDGFGLKKLTAQVDGEGRITQQWLKADLQAQQVLSVIEAAKLAFSDITGTSPIIRPPKFVRDDYVSIIPLVDWHIGLLAWAEECGENYDLAIAEKVIMDAMARIIGMTPPSKECVILGLGDMLHSDGYDPFTKRSKNVLDVDGVTQRYCARQLE